MSILHPVIRKMTEADSAALFEFYTTLSEAITSYFLPFPNPTVELFEKHLNESVADAHISIGIIDDTGKIVGHGFVLFADTDKPVFGIGLNETIHGKGLGRQLTEIVLRKADAATIPTVTLTVLKVNKKAKVLYEKMGFELKGEETFKEKNDSYYMERFHACKSRNTKSKIKNKIARRTK